MFQAFMQSAFSQSFVQVKKKGGKTTVFFKTIHYMPNLMKNTLGDLLNEASHICVHFHL